MSWTVEVKSWREDAKDWTSKCMGLVLSTAKLVNFKKSQ